MGFKCCKTRSASYYVCKNCLQIFHKSCLSRMSKGKFQHFADNVIICCAIEENDSQKEKSYLEETILGLEEDNALKEKHIVTLKNNHSVLLQDAMETENDLRNTIITKDTEIENLRNELEKVSETLRSFDRKEMCSASCQTLLNTTKSVQTMTNDLPTSTGNDNQKPLGTPDLRSIISSSSTGNDRDHHEVQMEKRGTLSSLANQSTPYIDISSDDQFLELSPESEPTNRSEQHETQNARILGEADSKCKLLIIGDEYGEKFAKILDLVMDTSNLNIDEVIKPNTELSDITKDLFSKVLNYDSNDFVIVMFNTKNISNNMNLKFALKNLLPLSKITNIIIMSELNHNLDQIIINTFIKKIRSFKRSNRISSIDFYVDNRCRGSKYKLVKEIESLLKQPRISNIVLKSVNIVTDITENSFFRP